MHLISGIRSLLCFVGDTGRFGPRRVVRQVMRQLFRWTLRLAGSQRQPKRLPSEVKNNFLDYYIQCTCLRQHMCCVLHLNFSLELPFVICLPIKVDKQTWKFCFDVPLKAQATTVLRGEKRRWVVGSVSQLIQSVGRKLFIVDPHPITT